MPQHTIRINDPEYKKLLRIQAKSQIIEEKQVSIADVIAVVMMEVDPNTFYPKEAFKKK